MGRRFFWIGRALLSPTPGYWVLQCSLKAAAAAAAAVAAAAALNQGRGVGGGGGGSGGIWI